MLTVTAVEPAGAASRAGIRAGDRLASLDGNPVTDMLDLASGGSLLCRAEYVRGGARRYAVLRRNPTDTGWGLHVEGEGPRRCRNRCVFCFVDQNPPGVRPGLRVRDDDMRHSFLHGTYVTLDDGQVELALDRGLSPVYVSVHTTDPVLRGRLLGRNAPAPVVPGLERLREGGIEVRGQVVVVPGLNDGRPLQRTLSKLREDRLVSDLGVVPVGLTDHRCGLPRLRRPTAKEAAELVETCLEAGRRAIDAGLGRWVWPADELLLMAGVEVPDPDFYEGCHLRENGIGMLASLAAQPLSPSGSGIVVTGALAAPYLRRLLAGSGYGVAAAPNGFFGPMVGVAGLLSGADAVSAIRRLVNAGEAGPFFLPSVMFNCDSLTLDDLTLPEITRAAGAEVLATGSLEELP
ncbi:MAG: DUF512 domain-containing protein [Candidatus Fermentibacteraceae bacterium]